ncbi:MAG: hypothetical protein M3P24_01450, partial [Gemmatimonadota bacterium]|nr:hypothetical protein [Gemmatimonadota bacterium]
MIELERDALVFTFPEVHPDATLRVEFQRTLRIPDDGRAYPLPPGLGRFPLRHVDDFAGRVPETWMAHGGVMLPMYQSEATWLSFSSPKGYPFAAKVATGKVSAVTGEAWREGLHRDPQDYLSIPRQPWLDGYCVARGAVRQFVAMPLGAGYSAEEQVTGRAEHGGLQVSAYPVKREVWERILEERRREQRRRMMLESVHHDLMCAVPAAPAFDMGLAPGGRMRQEIYEDPYALADWDQRQCSRCFVHVANSLVWRSVTGEAPPTVPPTAAEYTRAGLPWFDYYAERAGAVEGSSVLGKLKSVFQLGKEKGDVPLPENESVTPARVVRLRDGLRP